jgi:outer membrane protein OmpA-like peptidoglycan-associated protein
LHRNELRSCIALGVFVVLVAVLALRFDLVSLLLPDVPAPAVGQRASAPKRTIAADTKIASLASRRLDDRSAEPAHSSFDVVRIAPDGLSVFAGRAPPNSSVTVLANDTAVATAMADNSGEWSVVIDRQFAPGEYQLSLTTKSNGSSTPLPGQSVRITIASSERPVPVVAKAAAPKQYASMPAPITFPYDEADVTAVGRKQALALSEFLRQRQLDSVTLSGHADDRGSDEYNMALSRRRLESVARHLRESGYAGKLVLLPKGRSEPFASPDRPKLPKDAAYQLDRRVELHLAR